jgi:hypothetical protein
MRGRPVIVQAAVAAGALALAAAVWVRPPRQGAPGDVPVVALGRGEVRAAHWDDGSHQVDVTRVVGADSRAVWVRIATSPTLQAPDGGTSLDGGVPPDAGSLPAVTRPDAGPALRDRGDAGAHARTDGGVTDALRAIREAPPPPPRELLGNDVAGQLLDRLSPPMATRDLGAVTPGRKRELGLEASTKRLRLETQGRTLDFVVSTPPGAAGAYLLAPDGHLWLVQDSLVQDLSAASSRLVDRRLHAFRADEPDTLQLQLDGRSRSFVVRRSQGTTRVAPVENPDSASAEATGWADRMFRLSPLEVLGRGETPRDGAPVVMLRVEYGRNRRPLGFVELGRAGAEWYARTEHTAGWVRLPPGAATLREQAERLEAGTPSTPR